MADPTIPSVCPPSTAGMCGGPSPHFLCPERAMSTGALAGGAALLVGFKPTTAAIVAACAWYAASGRWWV